MRSYNANRDRTEPPSHQNRATKTKQPNPTEPNRNQANRATETQSNPNPNPTQSQPNHNPNPNPTQTTINPKQSNPILTNPFQSHLIQSKWTRKCCDWMQLLSSCSLLYQKQDCCRERVSSKTPAPHWIKLTRSEHARPRTASTRHVAAHSVSWRCPSPCQPGAAPIRLICSWQPYSTKTYADGYPCRARKLDVTEYVLGVLMDHATSAELLEKYWTSEPEASNRTKEVWSNRASFQTPVQPWHLPLVQRW